MRGESMPTKFCPHCGKRTGFQVTFNVSCRIGDQEEKAYLRECQDCGGRFITIQKDERMNARTAAGVLSPSKKMSAWRMKKFNPHPINV